MEAGEAAPPEISKEHGEAQSVLALICMTFLITIIPSIHDRPASGKGN